MEYQRASSIAGPKRPPSAARRAREGPTRRCGRSRTTLPPLPFRDGGASLRHIGHAHSPAPSCRESRCMNMPLEDVASKRTPVPIRNVRDPGAACGQRGKHRHLDQQSACGFACEMTDFRQDAIAHGRGDREAEAISIGNLIGFPIGSESPGNHAPETEIIRSPASTASINSQRSS